MEKVKLGRKALLYPGAALIGANVDGKPNFMTISQCGLAAYKPPALVVPLNKFRYTLKGIKQNGTFSVNMPSSDMVKNTDYCGIYSGKKRDKSEMFTVFYGQLEMAPLIEECPLNFECRAIHYLDLASHMLVVGEIAETYLAESCMIDGKPDASKIDPLIYITQSMTYYRLGKAVAQAFYIGKEAGDARSAETVRADCLRGR